MKLTLLTLMIVMSLTTMAWPTASNTKMPTTQSAESSQAKLEQELTKLFIEWHEARKRGDTEAMSKIMGEEWTFTNAVGEVITPKMTLNAAKLGFFKNAQVDTRGASDSKINVYGDILTWSFRRDRLRNFTVWVKRDGRWQWVGGAQTLIPDPNAK